MMQMSARLLFCPRLAVKCPLSALRNVCLSYIYIFFLSRFCRRCFHCADDCEINLACSGKVVRLYVKSQKWPSESADLHFICLIMHLNKHFIMHHTQSKTLALLDLNKTCSNLPNHNLSCCLWGKSTLITSEQQSYYCWTTMCIHSAMIIVIHMHLSHGMIRVNSLQSICAVKEQRSTVIQMNVAHLHPQLLKIN